MIELENIPPITRDTSTEELVSLAEGFLIRRRLIPREPWTVIYSLIVNHPNTPDEIISRFFFKSFRNSPLQENCRQKLYERHPEYKDMPEEWFREIIKL